MCHSLAQNLQELLISHQGYVKSFPVDREALLPTGDPYLLPLLPFYSPFLLTLLQPTWALLLFPKYLPKGPLDRFSLCLEYALCWLVTRLTFNMMSSLKPSRPAMGFPGGSAVKNLPANARDMGSIPGLGKFPWSRKWQPTPVSLPGKSHGQRSLVDYNLWGLKELDTTEQLTLHTHTHTHTHTHFFCIAYLWDLSWPTRYWSQTMAVKAQNPKY